MSVGRPAVAVMCGGLLGRLSERTGKISGASFRSDEC
jgi:hypothetical protein